MVVTLLKFKYMRNPVYNYYCNRDNVTGFQRTVQQLEKHDFLSIENKGRI